MECGVPTANLPAILTLRRYGIAKRAGGKGEVPLRLLDQLTQENGDNPEFPVLDKTPLYMRESLLFPYNQGARFQDAVYRKMGRGAFEAVFAQAPSST